MIKQLKNQQRQRAGNSGHASNAGLPEIVKICQNNKSTKRRLVIKVGTKRGDRVRIPPAEVQRRAPRGGGCENMLEGREGGRGGMVEGREGGRGGVLEQRENLESLPLSCCFGCGKPIYDR